MKILVLESSPNRHGSSNMLAGEFIRGSFGMNLYRLILYSMVVLPLTQLMQNVISFQVNTL